MKEPENRTGREELPEAVRQQRKRKSRSVQEVQEIGNGLLRKNQGHPPIKEPERRLAEPGDRPNGPGWRKTAACPTGI